MGLLLPSAPPLSRLVSLLRIRCRHATISPLRRQRRGCRKRTVVAIVVVFIKMNDSFTATLQAAAAKVSSVRRFEDFLRRHNYTTTVIGMKVWPRSSPTTISSTTAAVVISAPTEATGQRSGRLCRRFERANRRKRELLLVRHKPPGPSHFVPG